MAFNKDIHQRQPLFGDIVDGGMMLNAAGVMVAKLFEGNYATLSRH